MRRRRAVIGLHQAEEQVLIASHRAARRAAVQSIHAALSARHGSAVSAVLAKFADRRAALVRHGEEGERAAALRHVSADEAHELARLALEHAAEKRALRKSMLAPMERQQCKARRELRRRNRRQRMILAIQLAAPRLRNATSTPSTRTAQTVKFLPFAVDRMRRPL